MILNAAGSLLAQDGMPARTGSSSESGFAVFTSDTPDDAPWITTSVSDAMDSDYVPEPAPYSEPIGYDDPVPTSLDEVPVGSTFALEGRIQRLESELAQLKAQQGASVNPFRMLDHQLNAQDRGTGGLFGSVEVLFLRPHLSGAPAAFGFGAPVGRLIDSDYTTSVRYVLGYVTDSGIGIRGRYWSMADDYTFVPPLAPNEFGMALDTADLEATLLQRLRHFDLELSGGVRYGKLHYTNAVGSFVLGAGSLSYEGVGPTMSIMARRSVAETGLSLFGGLRGSMLIGDIRNGAILPAMPATVIEEELMMIGENQLGISWSEDLSQAWNMEVRLAWETQYWANSTLSDDAYGLGSNLALSGPTIAVELKY